MFALDKNTAIGIRTMNLNKINLIGMVGKKPELKTTQEGDEVAFLSLATNSIWVDKEGNKKRSTQWHSIIAFDDIVDVIKEKVDKSDKLYIEGTMEYKRYEINRMKYYRANVVLRQHDSELIILSKTTKDTDDEAAESEENLYF